MSAASAVNPLRVAVVAALKTIPALASDDPTIGAHVYHEGEVRRGDPLPRIVLGGAFETRRFASRYGQVGHSGNLMLKCWHEDSWLAQELYDASCVALVTVVPLVLEGHKLVQWSMDRVTDYPEPDPEITAHVVIGRYEAQTRVA